MSAQTLTFHLQRHLQRSRDDLAGSLEGLSEYDVRRPLVPSGTNLLGLVKHLTIVEAWYFGKSFDRPFPEELTWWDDDAEPNVEMWAMADETRAGIVDRYRRACAHADATIEALDLSAVGQVPWWRKSSVTLHGMLVHVLAETCRHAGHADIIREQVDGAAGLRSDNSNLPEQDAAWWEAYRAKVEEAARAAV